MIKELKIRVNLYTKIILFITLFIFAVVPFQGLITMWPTSIFGHRLFWQIAKDLTLILPIFVILYLLITQKNIRVIYKEKIMWLILGYVLVHLLLFLFHNDSIESSVAGLILNLRLFVFFGISYVAGLIYKDRAVSISVKLIMIVAVMVSIFGIFQMILLPSDILSHVGYNGDPIPARFSIDDDINSVRIASTTRGPNNLGAYLVIPLVFVFYQGFKLVNDRLNSKRKTFLIIALVMLLLLVSLYGTHSRSAFIGFVIAICTWLLITLKNRGRKILFILMIASIFVSGVSAYLIKDSYFFKATVLHDIEGVGSSSTSNQGHVRSLKEGVVDVYKNKFLGCGPGCAGPASVRSKAGSKIAENYYVQIIQEVGIIGLSLFVAINVMVLRKLWKIRDVEPLALVLIASYAGISVINILLHAWADDTLAYTWWGMAGLVIGSYSHQDSGIANAKNLHTFASDSSEPSS